MAPNKPVKEGDDGDGNTGLYEGLLMSALFLTPLVISRRLPQLWFEALHPNPLVSDESRLAVTEKVEAFAESLMASQVAMLTSPITMALDMMGGKSALSAALGAQKSIAHATVRPIEKRLRKNLRRLTRR